MKNFIFIILLFSFIYLNAQDNFSFTENGSHWFIEMSYTTTQGPGQPPETHYLFTHYYIQGDTVIDQYIFKKMYVATGQVFDTSAMKFFGFVREEGMKVYFDSTDFQSTIIDMSLGVDDLFRFAAKDSYIDLRVVDVDSVLINSVYRKRIVFENFPDRDEAITWVDGIGDITFGLNFNYGFLTYGDSFNSTLKCFSHFTETVYGDCSVSTVGEEETRLQFRIFPNPVSTLLEIESSSFHRISRVSILNYCGIVVRTFVFNGQTAVQIPMNGLVPGVYIIEVRTSTNNSYFAKVVKE